MNEDRQTLCAASQCRGKPPHVQGQPGCHFYDEVRATLNQRGANYGTFMTNAAISEELMAVIMSKPGWANFEADQRAATWIMMQKLSRALSGNAQYDDNWRDIAGYATLIVDRINGTGTYATTKTLADASTTPQGSR